MGLQAATTLLHEPEHCHEKESTEALTVAAATAPMLAQALVPLSAAPAARLRVEAANWAPETEMVEPLTVQVPVPARLMLMELTLFLTLMAPSLEKPGALGGPEKARRPPTMAWQLEPNLSMPEEPKLMEVAPARLAASETETAPLMVKVCEVEV